jgi:hypothetical protein
MHDLPLEKLFVDARQQGHAVIAKVALVCACVAGRAIGGAFDTRVRPHLRVQLAVQCLSNPLMIRDQERAGNSPGG